MMQKNKLLGFGCMAVLISSYSFVMWDLASADCFVRFIQSFIVSLLFLAGVWVCLDLINRKHNTKNRKND